MPLRSAVGLLRTPEALVGVVLVATVGVAPGAAQVEIVPRTANITVGGRVHAQLLTSSSEDGPRTDFVLRRARLTFDAEINDFLDGRIQPDFGESEIQLKDAYFRLRFDPAFRVSAGHFKRAFDIFELTSSTQILVVERDGDIPGLSQCAGIGGICSLSQFSPELAYSDRDTGIRVDGSLDGGRWSYMATVTNGTGEAAPDENDGKSFAGRVVLQASEQVRVAANVSMHDFSAGDFENEMAGAWGGDLEIGDFDGGLHVMAGFIRGDNWLELTGDEDDPPMPATFFTAQGIVSYKHALPGSDRFEAIQPVFRLSWGDPDRTSTDDGGLLVTPGLKLFVQGRNKIAVNLDVYRPQSGSTEASLKVQTYLYF